MEGVPAIYLGQIVDKKHFRTFVYGMGGAKKLVESWDEFESHMQSGLWFSTQEDAASRIPVEKPKRVRKEAQVKPKEVQEQDDEPLIEEELITDDDFLPKTGD